MPTVPLSEQLGNSASVAAILLYGGLLLAPFVVLWRADRSHRWLAVGFAIAAVAVRLPFIKSTPPGVNWDDVGVLWAFSKYEGFNWMVMLRQGPVSGAPLWCNFPWYVTYRLTHSLLAMRIDGLAWSAVLSLYAVLAASRYFGLSGAAVTAAVLTFTPWSLWMSRHPWGPEIVLQQFYLFAAVEVLRTRPNLRAVLVCALMLVLLQLTYIAARISVVLPIVLLLAGPREAGLLRSLAFLTLAYVIAAFGMLPHVMTHPLDFWGSGIMTSFDSHSHDWWLMLRKAGVVLGSLASPEYSSSATLALRGAQTLSPVVLATVAVGALASLGGAGRGFLLAALLGAIPCWISEHPFGTSHRMMMMLLPLALLAGAAPRVVPPRFRTVAVACLVGLIAVTGLRTWFSHSFWEPLPGTMRWALPFRAAVEHEIERHDGPVRAHPDEGEVSLLALERGLDRTDLRTIDFAGHDPLTVVWRELDPVLLQRLERTPGVTVERVNEYIAVTRFPHGFQGVLGDPPRFGWRFSIQCERGAERQLNFITPLLMEAFPYADAAGPCTFQWRAKALRSIEKPLLSHDGALVGIVRIDETVVPVVPRVTSLPTIEAGQRIAVELKSPSRALSASLTHVSDGARTFLDWEAVAPDVADPGAPASEDQTSLLPQ